VCRERVAVFALARHHDDQAPRRYAAQFRNGAPVIEQVFDHMRADHGVKGAVFER
jgi:hypothetical protein